MKAIIAGLAGVCWFISIPCTVLVIIFQFAKENAEWVYNFIDPEEEPNPNTTIRKQTFEEKLAERMKNNPPPIRKNK